MYVCMSVCAAPRILYLPVNNLGLSMRSISTLYKTLQISRFYSLICSQDNCVCRLVNHKASVDKEDNHHKFRSSATTTSLLHDVTAVGNNGNNTKCKMTSIIQLQDTNQHLDHLKSCVVQGSVFRLLSFKGEEMWSRVVSRFNDKTFSFVIDSIVDVLPHKVNLNKWQESDTRKCPLCDSDLDACVEQLFLFTKDQLIHLVAQFCSS